MQFLKGGEKGNIITDECHLPNYFQLFVKMIYQTLPSICLSFSISASLPSVSILSLLPDFLPPNHFHVFSFSALLLAPFSFGKTGQKFQEPPRTPPAGL